MGFGIPFFRGGRLVQNNPVTTLKAKAMEAAASWQTVSSSNVKAICWREDKKDGKPHGLGVWFAPSSGKETLYFYKGAPYELFVEMRGASSKGVFVHQRLKGKFETDGPYPPGF